MIERDDRRTIDGLQAVEDGVAGGNEIGESASANAGAGVEGEHDTDWNVHGIDDIHSLENAVVAQLEVARGQAGNRFAAVHDEHVHADAKRPRRKRLKRQHRRQHERETPHHRIL